MNHLRDWASTTAAFEDDLNLRIAPALTRPLTSTAVSEIPVAAVEVRRLKGAPDRHLKKIYVYVHVVDFNMQKIRMQNKEKFRRIVKILTHFILIIFIVLLYFYSFIVYY